MAEAALIDGKAFAANLRARIGTLAASFAQVTGRRPGLAVVLVGEDPASQVYVGAKARADLAIGMRVFHEKFGYGEIMDIDGNKLEVEFEQAGSKRVLDSFIKLA